MTERQRDLPPAGSLPKCLQQQLGLGWARARSQELIEGLPPAWQGPRSLSHPQLHLGLLGTYSLPGQAASVFISNTSTSSPVLHPAWSPPTHQQSSFPRLSSFPTPSHHHPSPRTAAQLSLRPLIQSRSCIGITPNSHEDGSAGWRGGGLSSFCHRWWRWDSTPRLLVWTEERLRPVHVGSCALTLGSRPARAAGVPPALLPSL